jgi:hypothetical protein
VTVPPGRCFAAALLLCLLGGEASGAGRDVSNTTLAQAARDARLSEIDVFREQCADTRRVEDWLKTLLGDTARAIRWSGGRCQLINTSNPIDAGSAWCGQATILPKREKHRATIEVYFEKPKGGKPGVPYAFRAIMVTKDGPDYMRETFAFEVNWREKYLPGYQPPADQTCDAMKPD